MIPVVGHMGIVQSDGLIHDFGGPYYVSVRSSSLSSLSSFLPW